MGTMTISSVGQVGLKTRFWSLNCSPPASSGAIHQSKANYLQALGSPFRTCQPCLLDDRTTDGVPSSALSIDSDATLEEANISICFQPGDAGEQQPTSQCQEPRGLRRSPRKHKVQHKVPEEGTFFPRNSGKARKGKGESTKRKKKSSPPTQ